MKSRALTLAAFAAFGIASAAHAQSSVTLYGVIDTSLTYVSHAEGSKNLWALGNSSAGNLSGSRWGVKGSEDLGGGLKAIFALENGFNPSTGASGSSLMFGRQAFVGLASEQYGTLTLGRQYDPLVDLIQGITADNYFGSVFATAGDVDNYDNSFRVNNAVKYVSPVYRGLQAEVMYSFGGVAGSTGSEQSYSAALAYNNGPLAVAAGYYYAANSSGTRSVDSGWTSTSGGTFDSTINNGYQTAHSLQIARIAAQYTVGSFILGAGYSNAQYASDADSSFTGKQKYNTAQGYLAYQATPALLVGAGYSYTNASGDTSANYHQFSLGGDYNLSKRTDVYMTAAYQHASGTTRQADGDVTSAQASIGSYGYTGTGSQTLVNLGLRHRF
jgi:predicted porin